MNKALSWDYLWQICATNPLSSLFLAWLTFLYWIIQCMANQSGKQKRTWKLVSQSDIISIFGDLVSKYSCRRKSQDSPNVLKSKKLLIIEYCFAFSSLVSLLLSISSEKWNPFENLTNVAIEQKILCNRPLHCPKSILLLIQEIFHGFYINSFAGHCNLHGSTLWQYGFSQNFNHKDFHCHK